MNLKVNLIKGIFTALCFTHGMNIVRTIYTNYESYSLGDEWGTVQLFHFKGKKSIALWYFQCITIGYFAPLSTIF